MEADCSNRVRKREGGSAKMSKPSVPSKTTKKDWLKRGIHYRCKHCGQIEIYGGLTKHLVHDHEIPVFKIEHLIENYERIEKKELEQR
jgi:hypothetical protein